MAPKSSEPALASPSGELSFAAVLSRAVAHRRITLDEIRDELARRGHSVSKATLSYWRTGQSIPARPASLAVIEELEQVLRLPLGQLRASLPSDAFTEWDPVVAMPLDDQVRGALVAMGLPETPFEDQRDDYVRDSIWIPAGRQEQVETTHQLIYSQVDELTHVPIVLRHDFTLHEVPLARGGRGCELSRVVQLEDADLLLFDFELPRPVKRGQSHMFDYSIVWDTPPNDPFSGFCRGQLRHMPLYSIDITFECPLPKRMVWRTSPYVLGPPEDDGDLVQEVEVHQRVEMTMADVSPGKYALFWYYDQDVDGAGGRA